MESTSLQQHPWNSALLAWQLQDASTWEELGKPEELQVPNGGFAITPNLPKSWFSGKFGPLN